jgi:hypothetical protein
VESVKVVRELTYTGPLTKDQMRGVYRRTVGRYKGRWYDVGALAFGLLAYPFRRFTRIIKRNLWGSRKAFMCVELIEATKAEKLLPTVKWPETFDKMTPEAGGDLIASDKYIVDTTGVTGAISG